MPNTKTAYPTVFTREEDGTVLIEVPDLEVLTEGKDYPDAIRMARDAIGLKGITLEDEGIPVPDASDPEKIDFSALTFGNKGNSIITLVDIDFGEYRRNIDKRAVRKNVTIPAWLDFEAKKARLNLSRVLQEALKERLSIAD